jgi:hypothetical protein
MSVKFQRLDLETQKLLAENEPAVVAALCEIANKAFNLPADRVRSLKEARRWGGVNTAEGGIHVNGKELRLLNGTAYLYMCEGWKEPGEKPEEQQLANAVSKVVELVEQEGIEGLENRYQTEIKEYEEKNLNGDPLYQFLGPQFH